MNNVDLSPRCITPGMTNSPATCAASPTPTGSPTNTSTPTATATSTVTATATPTATPIPLSGSYNVGAGQQFTSLTMPGGIFEALDYANISGNVTINITSDLMGENGVIALNEFNPMFSIVIRPAGGPRTISGASSVGIIRLNAADHVTIDGSTTGATVTGVVGGNPALRELTIQNNDTSTSSSVIILDTGSNGAQNNTLKNLNVRGSGPDQTGYLISVGAGTGGSHGDNNDFNTIENCSLRRSIIGIWMSGGNGPTNQQNVISENDATGTGVDRIRRAAMSVGSQFLMVIKENSIGGIDSNTTDDVVGIGAGVLSFTNNMINAPSVSNSDIFRNKVNGVQQTGGRSAGGIVVLCTGCHVYNNMVSGVISDASGSSRLVAGIYAAGSSAVFVEDNSVSMTGDRGSTVNQAASFALALGSSSSRPQVVSNILYTTQTSSGGANAKSYALGIQSPVITGSTMDDNDHWSSGANDGGFRGGSLLPGGGTDYADLAAWRTATGQDSVSIEADPIFANPSSDLHIQNVSPARNAGGAGLYPDDFDGDARPQEGLFDIGADEYVPAGSPTATPTSSGTPSISGVVTYANATAPPKFVPNATVCASGSPVVCALTNTSGQYVLTGFGSGSYTLSASKTGQTNGISSNDAARIAQHVAGISLLTTNVQKITADVSNNGAVSSNDAAKIAQYVAGVNPLPPPNLSATWRFFVPNPTFPLGSSPTGYNYAIVNAPITNQDLWGILGGDVTGNWNPAGPRPVKGPERSVAVELPAMMTETNKQIVIPVRVIGAADRKVISYEFDLKYDPSVIQPGANVVDIKGTASRALSYVVNPAEPGLLRVVMYGALPIDGKDVLLHLTFTAVGARGSISPLTFERITFNEGDPGVSTTAGKVELF